MDKATFMLWCILGIGLALAVLFALGPARRARISSLAWWSCMTVGLVIAIYGLSHSTTPSFAPHISAVGRASAFVQKSVGRSSRFVFMFVPEGGVPLELETHIIVPHWSNAAVFDARMLRITYLGDPFRNLKNEVIAIEILSGENAGWHDSFDARPLGIWLAIPFGALIGGFGYIGLRFRKDDLAIVEFSKVVP